MGCDDLLCWRFGVHSLSLTSFWLVYQAWHVVELAFRDSDCNVMSTVAIGFKHWMGKSGYLRGWWLFQSASKAMDLFYGHQSRASSDYRLLWSQYGMDSGVEMVMLWLCSEVLYRRLKMYCFIRVKCDIGYIEYTSKSTSECFLWQFLVYAALFDGMIFWWEWF